MRIKSPCNNKCKLDADKICIGCKRTFTEICEWSKLTDEERLAVIENIKKRKGDR